MSSEKKRGPYKPKPPTRGLRPYKARRLIPPQPGSAEEPDSEPNFVTALIKAFVREKLTKI